MDAGAAFTVISGLMLVTVPSEAVIVSEPAVFNVTVKVFVPEFRVESLGRIAWLSDDVKCTVPV